MKIRIAAAMALAASTFAPLATAATYTFTFNDMSNVPDLARNTFNTARYWEWRGINRWGQVWESPLTFTTTFPAQTAYNHFHLGFKGQEQCYDLPTGSMGRYANGVNGDCIPLDPLVNRGPFTTHAWDQALYFQLIQDNFATHVPFVVKNIDVYNSATQSISLYVRKTDGGWFHWSPLHGHSTGTPNWFRWTLLSGYTGKFTAMAWKSVSGAAYPSSVGRVQVTD